jgi:hypothetical protein
MMANAAQAAAQSILLVAFFINDFGFGAFVVRVDESLALSAAIEGWSNLLDAMVASSSAFS